MDPKHSAEMFKHLEKQSELLMETYRSMSHDLHRLQVEEEMLMRKFYEIMSAQGLIKKNGNRKNASNGDVNGNVVDRSNEYVDGNGENDSNEEKRNGNQIVTWANQK